MKWRQDRKSENVEDRRSAGQVTGGSAGSLRGRIPGGTAGGLGGLGLILVLILLLALGGNLGDLLGGTEDMGQRPQLTEEQQNQLADHVSRVLADTEITWEGIFQDQLGNTYREPKLVLFTGYVESACGQASSAVGPFYCSGDEKVYLDLDFFYELQEQFGAPGDFAQAYVVAHEIGHHVQYQVGTLQYVDAKRRQVSEVEANTLSVALELQADCYAGVWAHQASERNLILEEGDVEEGLNAASAIGDDRLQQQAQGYVVPDSFTHGTSAQRVEWFRKGLMTGEVAACDSSLLPAVT